MPLRPCLQPGCPQLVRNASRCPDHTLDPRPSAAQRGYGRGWQRLAAQARDLQPWCTDCGTEADLTVDHLRWPAETLDDVQVVCRACNSRRGPRRSLSSAAVDPAKVELRVTYPGGYL